MPDGKGNCVSEENEKMTGRIATNSGWYASHYHLIIDGMEKSNRTVVKDIDKSIRQKEVATIVHLEHFDKIKVKMNHANLRKIKLKRSRVAHLFMNYRIIYIS